MAKLEVRLHSLYAGHGNFYHIEMQAEDGDARHIIVDAGSLQQKGDPVRIRQNIDEVVGKLVESGMEESVILCTTHMDYDHISFIKTIYDKVCSVDPRIIDRVIVTMPPAMDVLERTAETLDCKGDLTATANALLDLAETLIIDELIDEPEVIFDIPGIDVVFGVLCSWLCVSTRIDTNSNTSVFYLRCASPEVSIVWFMGDATGGTMTSMLERDNIRRSVANLTNGAHEVYMTTPHHGSIHSLIEDNFISDRTDREGISRKNLEGFLDFMHQGHYIYGLYVNADFNDRFLHPDDWTMRIMENHAVSKPSQPLFYLTYRHAFGGYSCIADTVIQEKFWARCHTGRHVRPAFTLDEVEGPEEEGWEGEGDYPFATHPQNHHHLIATVPYEPFYENEAAVPAPPNDRSHAAASDAIKAAGDTPAKSPKAAMEDTSFERLFGPIGPMVRSTGAFSRFDAQPIATLALGDYREEAGGAFAGTLDASASDLARYPWLAGAHVSGTKTAPGAFIARAAVSPEAPALAPLPIEFSYAQLVIEGRPATDTVSLHTNAELIWNVSVGTDSALAARAHIPLLREEGFPPLLIDFGTMGEGVALTDVASVITDVLGARVDFARLFPASLPFAANVRLFTLRLALPGAAASGSQALAGASCAPQSAAFTFGYVATPTSVNGFDYLRFTVGFAHLDPPRGLSLTLEAKLTLGGVAFRFTACAPLWQAHIRSDLEAPIALPDVAKSWGCSLPPFFAGVQLETAMAEFSLAGVGGDLSAATFDFALLLGFAESLQGMSAPLQRTNGGAQGCDGIAARLLDGTVSLERRGGRMQAELSGALAFYQGDTYLLSIRLSGALAISGRQAAALLASPAEPEQSAAPAGSPRANDAVELLLSGALLANPIDNDPDNPADAAAAPYPSFADVYAALTGQAPLASWPAIEITHLKAQARCASAFSITSFQGGVRITLDDARAFPIKTELAASIDWRAADDAVCIVTGSFKLGERFEVRACATLGSEGASWALDLVLGPLELRLSCAGTLLSATVDASVGLADVVDALLKAFNWSDSFKRSGAWSFLNGTSLQGTKVTYDTATSVLRLDVKPSCSSAFLELDAFAIVANASGVVFEITGTFDGVDYSADKPLRAAPNNLPSPSGNALKVDYLGLGGSIDIPGMTTTSVERGIDAVKAALSPSAKPSDLSVSRDAGILLAADFTVAQTVRIHLLSYGRTSFIGGRFQLFGDKAGPLDGLVAEFSYVRVNSQLGVFSGDFSPPASLKRLRLGPMTFGLGRIAARVYTNADFEIDLGFPHNSDFARSFSFSYGAVSGAGGAYVKRHASAQPGNMPATQKGRFVNVLQLGLGMRVSLSKGLRAGLLSATAYFMLQGLFEGAYATFLPHAAQHALSNVEDGAGNAGAAQAAAYYRLSADVVLEGRVEGSVNFGLVGAAVTVNARANARLAIEAYRASSVAVTVNVQAQACVRVLFARIKFGFSLAARIDFTLGTGERAPWDNGSTAAGSLAGGTPPRGAHPLWQAEPLRRLVLPPVRNDVRTIAVGVVTAYTVRDGLGAIAFMGRISADDFSAIVSEMARLLEANGCAGEAGPLALFGNTRIFLSPEEVEAFLSERFVFEYAFADEHDGAESDVVMPLPAYFKLAVETCYASGQTDCTQRDLSSTFMVDDAFFDAMRAYYRSTSEESEAAARQDRVNRALRAGRGLSEEPVSLARQMFADYFDLIAKSLKAAQETAAVRGEDFDLQAPTAAQQESIAGTVMHFFLGGHRVLDELAEPQGDELAGNFERAGEQVFILHGEDVEAYRFALSRCASCPSWIRFAEGASSSTFEAAADLVRCALPAPWFADHARFSETPRVRPFFRTSSQPSFSLPATLCADTGTAYDIGGQMRPGERYLVETAAHPESTEARYVGLCKLELLKCCDDPLLWAVAGAARTDNVARWNACPPEDIERVWFLVADESAAPGAERGNAPGTHAQGAFTACSGATSYLARGIDGTSRADALAPFEDQPAWLALLARAVTVEQPCFLGFADAEQCTFADADEVDLIVCVLHTPCETYPAGFDALWVAGDRAEELAVTPFATVTQTAVPQGTLVITAETSAEGLTEAEQRLYDTYGSLAVKIADEGCHETPPFVARNDEAAPTLQAQAGDGGAGAPRRLSAQLPYARSLGADDVYAPVHERRALDVVPVWIDLFGNAHEEPDLAVPYVPRYVDDVVGFGAYPRLAARFFLRAGSAGGELVVGLEYAPAESIGPETEAESQEILDAALQLAQPDVQVELQSPLVDGPLPLDKEALVSMLRAAAHDPLKEARHEWSFPLAIPSDAFTRARASVLVARDADLVESDAPESVLRCTAELAGGSAPDRCRLQSAEGEPAPFAVFDAAEGSWVLGGGLPLATLGDISCHAVRPLPRVSGWFEEEAPADGSAPETVALNAVDLQQILERFMEDVGSLFEPAMIARFACSKVLGPRLDDAFALRHRAAASVARRVAPLAADAPLACTEAARNALAAALRTKPDVGLPDALVLGGTVAHPADAAKSSFALQGTVGEGRGFPTRIGAGDTAFGCVLDTQGSAFNLDGLALDVGRVDLIDGSAVRALTPVLGPEGFDRLPLGTAGTIRVPGAHRPSPPGIASATPLESLTVVALDWAPCAHDALEWFFAAERLGTRAFAEAPEAPGVFAMERYRRESPALVQAWTDEAVCSLLDLMADYLDALDRYTAFEEARCGRRREQVCELLPSAPSVSLAFEAGDAERLSRIVPAGEASLISEIRYRCDSRDERTMPYADGAFAFDPACLPRQGEPLLITIVWKNEAPYAARTGTVQAAYRPEASSGVRANPLFDQVSAALAF